MGRPPDHRFKPEGRVTAGAIEPLGDALVAAFEDGTVRVYGRGGDVRSAWKSGDHGFTALAFSLDGKRIAGGGRDGRVVLLEAGSGKELASFPAHATPVETIAVSRDGSVAATNSGSEGAAFRTAGGARLVSVSSPAAEASALAVAPGGGLLAFAFSDTDVRVVDAKTGRVGVTISDLDMAAFCLAFSPDSRLLACGCADGCVTIRDAATGARVRADMRHGEPIGAVEFSPDGAWVTSVGLSMNPGSREVAVRTTSVNRAIATADVLGVLPNVSLGFSRDGTAHVVSGNRDGVRVWDVPPPTSGSRA